MTDTTRTGIPVVQCAHHGPVTLLTLDRADAHNALNEAVLAELDAHLTRLAKTPGVRCIVITGQGEKAFSAGADLAELEGLDVARATDILGRGQNILRRVAAHPLPVIAAVNGLALGGGFELVLSCTFAVLSERAALGLPETGLGLMPGYGGTQRLPLVIGRPAAAHLMLTGERLDAARAHRLGLTPVPPVAGTSADVVAATLELAQVIAGRGPRAVRAVLTALSTERALDTGLALETALAGVLTGGSEAAAGIAAFRARRTPQFPDLESDSGQADMSWRGQALAEESR